MNAVPRVAFARIAELNRHFDELDLSFVDASIVALAESASRRSLGRRKNGRGLFR